MGVQLETLFNKALQQFQNDPKQLGVMKIRLVMKIGISTNQIQSAPDTPEMITKLKNSAKELGINL